MYMKRFPLPDLLKGFAVFLIVPVHILETFINYTGRESLFGKVLLLLGGPVAVPIFMMVMGYFVAKSKKTITQNLLRGLFIFILGFFLNIGLNFNLLLKIRYRAWSYDPLQFIFGVDIFYLAGLSIIVLAFIKRIPKIQQWIALIMILFISASTTYFNEIMLVTDRNYLLPFIAGNYSWSYFPIFPWLSYPLIGFLFQKNETRIGDFFRNRKKALTVVLTATLILVILFGKSGIETTINLSDYYHHGFWFFLWVLGVDLLWLVLLWFVVQKYAGFPVVVSLRWMGKNITVFYVIQWLIIGNIATEIYQTQELSKYIYWFIPIFLTTVALTFVFEKIFNPGRKQKDSINVNLIL